MFAYAGRVRRNSSGSSGGSFSHGGGTGGGRAPSRLAKRPAPPPSSGDGVEDNETVIEGPSLRSDAEIDLHSDDFFEVPDSGSHPRGRVRPDEMTPIREPGHARARHAPTPVAPAVAAAPVAKEGGIRRLSSTLGKMFGRRRKEIGLSLAQVAKLTGIGEPELAQYETGAVTRLPYEHAIVVSRVLGIRSQDMPGLRPREERDDVPSKLAELTQLIMAGPTVTFDGRAGEHFGGDVDRLTTMPAFALQILDHSLGEAWPKGSLLAFVSEVPQPGDVVILRHRRSKVMALRRLTPPTYAGLQPWQPAYVAGGEWTAIGRLSVVVPRVS